MTTLVQDINTALTALAPTGGVWNSVNTSEKNPLDVPFIVFQRVVSVENVSLGGPSDRQNTRIQVDVFDRSYASAAAMAVSVKAALLATFPSCVPLSSFDAYEDAIKAFRVSADYSIWTTN